MAKIDGSRQIESESVSGTQVKDETLESSDIKNGTVAFVDLSTSLVLDEDDMNSDSNTAIVTQQSIKKYVDDNKTITKKLTIDGSIISWSGSAGDYYYTWTVSSHGLSITDYDVVINIVDENGQKVIVDYTIDSSSNIKFESPIDDEINVTMKQWKITIKILL